MAYVVVQVAVVSYTSVILWTAAHQDFCPSPFPGAAETRPRETKTTLRELRTQVYYTGGPRGVNTPSSKPWTKGLQSLYMDRHDYGFTGAGQLAKSMTRVSEISSSPQYYESPLSRDYVTYVIQTFARASWVTDRRSRRL